MFKMRKRVVSGLPPCQYSTAEMEASVSRGLRSRMAGEVFAKTCGELLQTRAHILVHRFYHSLYSLTLCRLVMLISAGPNRGASAGVKQFEL